jgi:hypothetical protein
MVFYIYYHFVEATNALRRRHYIIATYQGADLICSDIFLYKRYNKALL